MHNPGALLLLTLAILSASCVGAAAGQDINQGTDGAVRHVSTGAQLAAALRDPSAGTIVVDRDVRLDAGDFPDPLPYNLTRNVTVTSDPAGPHRVIDFNARDVVDRLVLPRGVNISFVHVTLKDTRYGAGADVDIISPLSTGGVFYLHDLAKLQTSCAPLAKAAILAYQRDPLVPGINDIEFPASTTWDGKTYNDTILYKDFSTRAAATSGETTQGFGYVVHKRGSYKLCEKVVSADCIAQHGAPACIKMDQDEDYYTHYAPRPAALAPAAAAGVGAGVGGAALLAAAAAAVLLARRRRRRRLDYEAAAGGKGDLESGKGGSGFATDTGGKKTPHGSGGSGGGGVQLCCPNSSSSDSGSRGGSQDSAPATNASRTVSGTNADSRDGSSSLANTSRPSASVSLPDVLGGTLSRDEAARVSLGTLVGAGSYGRVFRGRYAGADLAVKVINHNRFMAAKVATEVKLTMGFDHPNVVRAYHFVTWGSSGVSRPEGSAALIDGLGASGAFTEMLPMCGLPSGAPSGRDSLLFGSSSSGADGNSRSGPMVETWILQEFCDAGTLQDAVLVRERGPYFTLAGAPRMGAILSTLLGVARGMEWLQARSVLHGDLKAANVLLAAPPTAGAADGSSGGSGSLASGESLKRPGCGGARLGAGPVELVPKVADFGLSRIMGDGASHLSTRTLGTITHQCPELIRTGRLAKSGDVFSFGVLMWEVAMADVPWKSKTIGEIITDVMVEGRRLAFGPLVPRAYSDLAAKCMAASTCERPTFSELAAALQELLVRRDALQAEADAAAAPAPAVA